MIDKERLEWLKKQLEHCDYVLVGQWGMTDVSIEGEVQHIIEELEKLRERERGYLAELTDYGRTVERLRQSIAQAATQLIGKEIDIERLTKRCDEARDYVSAYALGLNAIEGRPGACRWLEGKP